MDVVDQKNIYLAIFCLEIKAGVGLNSVDEVVCEDFAGDVPNFFSRPVLLNVVTNSVQKVSFTQTRVSINEQRVVSVGWHFGNSKRCSVSKSIGATLNKALKGISRI